MGVGFIAETMAEILMEKKRKTIHFPPDLRLRPGKLAGGPDFRGSAAPVATFAFQSDKPTGEASEAHTAPN
jgi:hypothetical protein